MHSFFGIHTSLELKKSNYKSILLKELKPYLIDTDSFSVVITDDWSSFQPKRISNNPKQHFYHTDTIHFIDKLTEIAFVFNKDKQLKKIYFRLLTAQSYARRILRKWLNMQYTNRIENITQIFHENVLIPLSFFMDDLTPIHASGFSLDGITTLLGGTGGTGKTTLELEFCLLKNASFITDDIGIIDNQGFVYPNYNNPKIYGYNLIDNPPLKTIIFKGKSILDKLHWLLHKSVFGVSKVRRKMDPFTLYNHVSTSKSKITRYSILSKDDIDKVEKHKVSLSDAIQMSLTVIATEYNYFFNHLKWHEFNALANNNSPIITIDQLEKRWKNNLETALIESENTIIKIPFDIAHKEFKKQTVFLISK